MSGDQGTIVFGGTPLRQRLSSSVHDLAAIVLDELVQRVPVYRRLPMEQLRTDISHTVEQSIRTFAEVLDTGRLPGPEQLAGLRESAAKRAEDGVPLEAVLSAYHLGAQVCLDRMAPAAEPADLSSVFATNRLVLQYLHLMTSAASAGYAQERQAAFGDEQSARQSLLAALLDGAPAEEAARRAGIRLPARYLVLGLRIGPHRDELRPGVDATVAARRKLRRARVELERHVAGAVLSMLSPDGGVALVPREAPDAEPAGKDWDWLATVVRYMSQVAGAEIWAGAVATAPDGVAEAARLAGQVCEVAAVFDRPAGVYRLADVALEYQLTRPGPARDELAGLLAPLAGKPELLETLRVFMAGPVDRRQTAAALQVHPNTVDYRLRKVAALTGLDTSRPADLPTIRAALIAHRVCAG